MHAVPCNTTKEIVSFNLLILLVGNLQAEGFSSAIIDRFFRPFLGGIFFDRGLGTTSRLFQFVMRCLATGQNCLPAAGIGAVADQLAARLPQGSIHTGMNQPLPCKRPSVIANCLLSSNHKME